jgi:hypothetical protein
MCCYPYSCALAAIWSDVSSAERVVERVKVAKKWCGLFSDILDLEQLGSWGYMQT